ncbi:head-tail connector protein [Jannaschia sp. M317]|uniref:head-tail connector protein n=1 Tax=Jannaschia sp. M317 TaxID=2867011 RepID=UPI0021A6967B|nr:head-tail connector protein [Jannaschia sp. M317]UWQ16152.1 head-tail connector protein [Jannaschia sp. M317]
MLRPVRIAPPAETPLSLSDAKSALREESDDQDAVIGSMIAAATGHLDGWAGTLGRCMVTQVWRYRLPCLTARTSLVMPDAQAVAASVIGADGSTTAIDPATLALQEGVTGAVLTLSGAGPDLPGDVDHPVQLDVTFGFGSAADVPAPIVQAIRLIVGHMYARREAVADSRLAVLPVGVSSLLAPYRWFG